MIILNGVDNKGDFTFYSNNPTNQRKNKGRSVVDYIIISSDLYYSEENCSQYVKDSMKVWNEENATLSDHRLITCKIKTLKNKKRRKKLKKLKKWKIRK